MSTRKTDIALVLDGGLIGGGAQRVAANLLRFWIDQGRLVTLITMRGPESDFYSIPPEVERIVFGEVAPSSSKLVTLIRNITPILRLRKAIRESDAQVIVSCLTSSNVRTLVASIGLGKRVVISERSDTVSRAAEWPWGLLRWLTYRFATKVTANSRAGIDGMKSYVPASKLALVPNPVVVPKIDTPRKRRKVVLSVGRLDPIKNQALIIRAFALLGDEGKDWTTEILGEGAERSNLTALAQAHGLANRVVFRGFVSDPSLYYLSSGIFVLPSLYEGAPNALLEAMAHGLACVVSDRLHGALAYVEDGVTGLVFRSNDAIHLTETLAQLMTNTELRARLGEAARKRMSEFTPDRVIAAWDAVLLGR